MEYKINPLFSVFFHHENDEIPYQKQVEQLAIPVLYNYYNQKDNRISLFNYIMQNSYENKVLSGFDYKLLSRFQESRISFYFDYNLSIIEEHRLKKILSKYKIKLVRYTQGEYPSYVITFNDYAIERICNRSQYQHYPILIFKLTFLTKRMKQKRLDNFLKKKFYEQVDETNKKNAKWFFYPIIQRLRRSFKSLINVIKT